MRWLFCGNVMTHKRRDAGAAFQPRQGADDWGWTPPEVAKTTWGDAWAWLENETAGWLPWLGPGDAKLAAFLIFSLAVTLVLQFGTSIFEWFPAFATGVAFLNAGVALFLGVLIVVRRNWERGPVLLLLLSAGVFVGALGSWGAKSQWRRGLAGSFHYALPAHPVPRPQGSLSVTLQAPDGVVSEGAYWGAHRPYGLVYVPGWRASSHSFSVVTLATWLSNDLDVLVLEPRGQGNSGGFKTRDGEERHDVLAAARYLRANGHKRVAVLAEQDACLPVLYAAAESQGLDALVFVAPSAHWGEGLGGALSPQSWWGRLYWRVAAGLRLSNGPEPPPVAELFKRVSPTPVWLLGTQSGAGTPLDSWYKGAQEPKGLYLFGGSGRPVDWAHFYEYYQSVAQWLALTLAPPLQRTETSLGE